MLKKIGSAILCAATLFSFNAHAMMTHSLYPGIAVEFKLPPNDPQLFINYTYWTLEANCQITSEDQSNELLAEVLAKKGKINGSPLLAEQSLRVRVQPGEYLRLSADSGAKVKVTNLGEHEITVSCTA